MIRRLDVRAGLLMAAGISGALLLGAHLFQWAGYDPCFLCLRQREPHWIILGVALVGAALTFLPLSRHVPRAALLIIAGIFGYAAWLGMFHAGVEWGFWAGPLACAAGSVPVVDIDPADLLGSLNEAGPVGPPCETAAWRLLGISMAGYQALASLAGMGLSAYIALKGWLAARGSHAA